MINRSKIFDHVMDLFSDESFLKEYPLHIKFEGEKALDLGGVRRDMLSGYWEEAYKLFFDGSTLLIPTVHPNINVSLLSKLGVILSHGYLVCGFVPTRIAFPSVACILLDTAITISSKILVEAFTECLSVHEAAILKRALTGSSTSFSSVDKDILTTIFSRYGCRSCPTPENIHSLTANTAKVELQLKPMAAHSIIASRIPLDEKHFWQSYSVEQLYAVYKAVNATPDKVLSILTEPIMQNEAQARVYKYLQQYIGNMKGCELSRFLCFTTGSSALLTKEISVTFNSNSGKGRSPIAHTCGCVLELPSTFFSYLEFEAEFTAVLENEHSWEMLAI